MNDGPEAPAAYDIASLIERLVRLLRSEEFDSGLIPAQWEALRYLARCNRFSDSPAALAAYMGSTRGTVSQTVRALERKGLVEKTPRQGEGRSVTLGLTDAGKAMLRKDPRRRVGPEAAALTAQEVELLGRSLTALLTDRLRRNGFKTFGICRGCRHFRREGAPANPDGPHRCGLLDLPLTERDTASICVEHEAA